MRKLELVFYAFGWSCGVVVNSVTFLAHLNSLRGDAPFLGGCGLLFSLMGLFGCMLYLRQSLVLLRDPDIR